MHAIQGLLLRAEGASDALRLWPRAKCVTLAQGIVWVPLRGASSDATESQPFAFWSDELDARLAQLSVLHPVAYFETEYFGGAGEQHATVYRAGVRDLRDGSVNDALERLGVIARRGSDAWNAVGLSEHRRMP